MFEFTSIRALADRLREEPESTAASSASGSVLSAAQEQARRQREAFARMRSAPTITAKGRRSMIPEDLTGIAIIGMSGRFPGASSVAEFWANQLAGIEGISQFSAEELEIVNARQAASDPNYIKARSILKDVDLFDAEFFSILPKEAALMDPQHRLFLECCWEAFEDAGYDPSAYPGSVGVMAGTAFNSYFHAEVCAQPGFYRRLPEELPDWQLPGDDGQPSRLPGDASLLQVQSEGAQLFGAVPLARPRWLPSVRRARA